MNLRKSVPSIASLGNVAAGIAACALALTGFQELGALIILAAVLLDSLDGALARSLEADSEFGAELDSLADVISFGVAPALLVGSLLPPGVRHIGWALIAGYPLCAAWRLARFNIARRRTSDKSPWAFSGLPTTGAGAAAATAVLVYSRLEPTFPSGALVLPCVLALLSALMVTRLPYKHASAIISRLNPAVAAFAAVVFVAGSVLWEYEYLFCALTWGYALSGPLLSATQKIRAVRHA